jgi:O-antigen ligase
MGLLALSIVVTKSRFGLILLIPVLIASIFILQRGELPKWASKRAFLIPAFALFAVVAAATLIVVARVPVDPSKPRIETRSEIWGHTLEAIDQYFPVGSGVGTFVPIYARFQPPERLNDIYVNHAHNDYLELLLEEGIPAAVLIIGAFLWFFLATIDVWRSQASAPFKRAATVSVFVVLIHSFVEYPARTAAIASILAYSAAVIASRPRTGGPIRSQ